ncbi:hypothetical protein RJ55_06567 [Drechmeria coniospora]|nr:hypothetical protein RJ55_06567 [Drechmeria coniospora]
MDEPPLECTASAALLSPPPAAASDLLASRPPQGHGELDSKDLVPAQSIEQADKHQFKYDSDDSPEDLIVAHPPINSDDDKSIRQRPLNLAEQLESEKRRYPGASTWAAAEERLFEILFLRQDLPLLPPHWDVDFRGVPMVESIFQAQENCRPIIFAHSSKEFQATMALLRLIDLTANVRTTCQSGLRHKAPSLIKKSISKFISWAAEDGGYRHLRFIPNIVVDTIDADMGEGDITKTMERRMRALARVQREFLRLDGDGEFWKVDEQRERHPGYSLRELLIEKYMARDDEGEHASPPSCSPSAEWAADEGRVSSKAPEEPGTSQVAGEPPKADLDDGTRVKTEPDLGEEVPLFMSDKGHVQPGPQDMQSEARYRRTPPVVYGLFILRTAVFLLTVDAAKGPTAYVSYHVDVHLMDRHQSVWNALTIALAVCLARDEMMTRVEDFEPEDLADESDPDV